MFIVSFYNLIIKYVENMPKVQEKTVQESEKSRPNVSFGRTFISGLTDLKYLPIFTCH